MKGEVRAAQCCDLHEKGLLLINLHSVLLIPLPRSGVLGTTVEWGRGMPLCQGEPQRVTQCCLHPGQQALLPDWLCIQCPVTEVRGLC